MFVDIYFGFTLEHHPFLQDGHIQAQLHTFESAHSSHEQTN